MNRWMWKNSRHHHPKCQTFSRSQARYAGCRHLNAEILEKDTSRKARAWCARAVARESMPSREAPRRQRQRHVLPLIVAAQVPRNPWRSKLRDYQTGEANFTQGQVHLDHSMGKKKGTDSTLGLSFLGTRFAGVTGSFSQNVLRRKNPPEGADCTKPKREQEGLC